MRHRIQLLAILFAWLAATGSQWDVVQVFAWARMMTNYAQCMPIKAAAELTFDANKPCSLCKAVKSAKEQEAETVPGGRADQKLLLVFETAPAYFYLSPETKIGSLSDPVGLSVEPSAPPTPPPRSLGLA